MTTLYEDRQLVKLAQSMMSVQNVVSASQIQGLWQSGIWTPGTPIAPFSAPVVQSYGLRKFDYDYGTNYGFTPRDQSTRGGQKLSSFKELDILQSVCNIASIALRYKINEGTRVKLRVAPRSGDRRDAKKLAKNIQRVESVLAKPDGKTYFIDWRTKYLREVYKYDALSMVKMRDRRGKFIGLRLVSGATIRPRIDFLGETVFYDQIIKGMPYARYIAEGVDPRELPESIQKTIRGELIYRTRWGDIESVYGNPPAQSVIDTLYTAIEHQGFHRAYWENGDIGNVLIGVPGNITGPQFQQFKTDMHDLNSGNNEKRQSYQYISISNSGDIKNQIVQLRQFTPDVAYFAELRKTILAPYGIVESELGWTEKGALGASAGQSQEDVKDRDTLSGLEWEKPFWDDVIQSPDMLDEPELEMTHSFGKVEDKKAIGEFYTGIMLAQAKAGDDGTGPVLLQSEIRQKLEPDLEPIDIVELTKRKATKQKTEQELLPAPIQPPAPPTVATPEHQTDEEEGELEDGKLGNDDNGSARTSGVAKPLRGSRSKSRRDSIGAGSANS